MDLRNFVQTRLCAWFIVAIGCKLLVYVRILFQTKTFLKKMLAIVFDTCFYSSMKTLNEIKDALLGAIVDLDEANECGNLEDRFDASVNLGNALMHAENEIALRKKWIKKQIKALESNDVAERNKLIGEVLHINKLLKEYNKD